MALKPLPFPVMTSPKVTEQDIMALQSGLQGAREAQIGANQTFEQALKDRLDQAMARELPVDLTPLAALTDQWSGSNFTKSYQPTETYGQRMKEVGGLQDRIGAAGLDTAELNTNQLKDRLGEALAGEAKAYGRSMDAFNQNYKERRDEIADDQFRQKLAVALKRANRPAATIMSPGAKMFDTKAAEKFVEFSVGGGAAKMASDIATLRNNANELEANPELTGSLTSNLPEWADPLKNFVNPGATDVRDSSRSVAANTIREVFGGNPTEGEGLRLMKFLFDEKQPASVNAARLRNFADKSERALNTRQQMYNDFVQSGGTLQGRQYQMPSVNSIMQDMQTTKEEISKKLPSAQTTKQAPKTSGAYTSQDLDSMTREQKIEALKKQRGGQ